VPSLLSQGQSRVPEGAAEARRCGTADIHLSSMRTRSRMARVRFIPYLGDPDGPARGSGWWVV